MRIALVALALVVAALALSSHAAAQESERYEDDETLDARALEDARYLRDVGAGLTLGGIAATGLGVGLMFGLPYGFEDVTPVAVGGLFEGLGGLAALAGIPMWIVGAIRAEALGRRGGERARIGEDYQLAGLVATLAAVGLGVVGGVLAATATGLGVTWPHDDRALAAMSATGFVFVPISAFVAIVLGIPLSAAGAQF
jgi:hypothetical protein